MTKKTISIVVPFYNEEKSFDFFKDSMNKEIDILHKKYNVELILVDDGSSDATWSLIRRYAEEYKYVRGISLSRNFGHQTALSCGYDFATGDAILCIDGDLQDPPELFNDMIEKWEEGYDIIYAVRIQREGETFFKLATAKIFYKLIRMLGAKHVQENCGDFRLMSKRSLDALNTMKENHRFIRGMVGWLGFKTTTITYDRHERVAGTTKYSLVKMLRLALDGIVSFSIAPLRLAYISAFILSMLSLGYLTYSFGKYWIVGTTMEPGWTSLILCIVGFGSMNLFCLGLIGEYVGRTFEQSKQRPLYFVKGDTKDG
jgi:dolichol-phosphate mannosyltransferase